MSAEYLAGAPCAPPAGSGRDAGASPWPSRGCRTTAWFGNDCRLMSDRHFLIRLAEDDDDFILDLVPRFVDFTLPAWRKRHECIEGIRADLVHHLDDQPPNSFL